MKPRLGPGARRVESSQLRWRKDGDSAVLDQKGARELDERSCPGPLGPKSGRPGGRDRSGGACPAELGPGYWKLML
jgi:hypothetical protein